MNNPSAFPVNAANLGDAGAYPADPGMDLRDWFAGQSVLGITGYLTNLTDDEAREEVLGMARRAYMIADALLVERGIPA